MYLRLYILIFSALITVGIRPSFAEDKKSTTSKSNWSVPLKESKDGGDIYIDDVLEGSGNNQEMREDLESSGSGFGPDDEDGEEPGKDIKEKEEKPVIFTKDDQSRNILPVNTGTNKEVPDIDIENTNSITNRVLKEDDVPDDNRHGNGVIVMNTKHEERATSFFAQPGILADTSFDKWKILLDNFSRALNASESESPLKLLLSSSLEVASDAQNVRYKISTDLKTNKTDENFEIVQNDRDSTDGSDHLRDLFASSDMLFFRSLLPEISSLNVTQKVKFRSLVLQALVEVLSKE